MITTITIQDAEHAEPEALGRVLARLSYHQNVVKATVWVNKREQNGWLEYLLVVEYRDGGKLTVGCIERAKGEGMEFHS